MVGEWELMSFTSLFDVKHGYAFSGENIREEPCSNILLTPGNFAIGGGFKGDKFKYFHGEVPEEYVLNEGDLLVTMTDLSKLSDTLGYPALVPNSQGVRFLHNQRLGKVIIKPGVELYQRFLYYLLRTTAYRDEILASATGTSIKHTSPARILAHKAAIPPLTEQRAIAHILGTLDDKIELNRRMNETLVAIARALFKSWFVDFDPVRAKAEGRETELPKHIADLFPGRLVESELGEIPEGWRFSNIDEIADINSWMLGRWDDLDVIDYIEISEVMRGEVGIITQFIRGEEPSRARRRLKHGDTVLSTVRPDRGAYFLALTPSNSLIASTGFAVLTPKDSNWAFLHVSTTRNEFGQELGRLADGGAYPAIRPEVVGNREIVLPNSSHLVTMFEEIAQPIFLRTEEYRKESRTLAAIRDTMLTKLLSGEICVEEAERIVGGVL